MSEDLVGWFIGGKSLNNAKPAPSDMSKEAEESEFLKIADKVIRENRTTLIRIGKL